MTPPPPPAGTNEEPTPPTPTPPPSEVVITRIPYPKWWKDLNTVAINLPGPGSQQLVSPHPGTRIYVATIALTVTDETNITFYFGTTGYGGPMKFGASGSPKGIVIAMGNSPAACGSGPFSIISDGPDAAVGGFVTYYQVEEEGR
jgi:hypothetical protein